MHLPQLAAQLAINLPQALERFGHSQLPPPKEAGA